MKELSELTLAELLLLHSNYCKYGSKNRNFHAPLLSVSEAQAVLKEIEKRLNNVNF